MQLSTPKSRSGFAPVSTFLIFAFCGLVIPSDASADYQCFYPFADTFVWDDFGSQRDENFGGSERLGVASIGDVNVDRRRTYLRFNLDVIPDNATILSADLELYLRDIEGSSVGQTFTRLFGLAENWSESSVTWNNRPSRGAAVYDEQTLNESTNTPGWRSWSADELVNAWTRGNLTNYGVEVSSAGLGSLPAIFDSREAGTSRQPRLCVRWTTQSVSEDLTVSDIEVTQAIQDLNNSVRLVAGKRTYVRVHAQGTTGGFRTTASLFVSNASGNATLEPINEGAGHIVVRQSPAREVLNHSFLFQLPTQFTSGDLSLTATVNPSISWRQGRYPLETSYANNSRSANVSFEEVPRIGIIGYLADYSIDEGGDSLAEYSTPSSEFLQMIDWIQRAYPVSEVWYTLRRLDLGEVTTSTRPNGAVDFDDPVAADVNADLDSIRQADLNEESWYDDRVGDPADIRYYGMVIDDGAFMRGRGANPGNTSSGPTGDGTWGWDNDGSYGDWYGGHEVGHNFSRDHAVAGCGSRGSGGFPYPNGRISPELTGDEAIFGFDIGTGYQNRFLVREQGVDIYGPDWRDVMSYCDNQWVSDFTYHGLMDFIQENVTTRPKNRAARVAKGTPADRLTISGVIDPPYDQADLQPIYILPNAIDPSPRVPGDHAIVLEDGSGTELARYPFTPTEMETGRTQFEPDQPKQSNLFISELVPHVAGTRRVVVEGPAGELARVEAGLSPPQVTLVAPLAGQFISTDAVDVAWTGLDADGDGLTYRVQFSHDAGATWETVSRSTQNTSIAIPRENLPTTDAGLFRVWATDGINTSTDTSSGTIELASRPVQIELISPSDGAYISAGQTLSLEANVYSPSFGSLETDQVVWFSSIDGILGNGARLSVTGLSPGVHDIQILANDGTQFFPVAEQINDITVVDHPALLPAPRDELELGPAQLAFYPSFGQTAQTLFIDNVNSEESLSWELFPLGSWVNVQVASGTTPAQVTVTVDPSGLAPGEHTSTIIVASEDVRGRLWSIPVTLWTHEPVPGDMLFRNSFEQD